MYPLYFNVVTVITMVRTVQYRTITYKIKYHPVDAKIWTEICEVNSEAL